MNSKPKEYGLLIPNKLTEKKSATKIFKEESDSEDEVPTNNWLKLSLEAKKKQTKIDIARALKDDPTVYQYDEIYDDIQKKKTEATERRKPADCKPRYIQLLMAQADRRKKENERRIERQIQKERDEEGDEFADKESFVTPSYKKKLEEMKLFDEEELKLNMLEDIADVSKQKDMTGFYRHLYRTVTSQELSQRNIPKNTENETKDITSDNDSKSSDQDEKCFHRKPKSNKRQYRKYREQSPNNEILIENVKNLEQNSKIVSKSPDNSKSTKQQSSHSDSKKLPKNNATTTKKRNLDSDTSLSSSSSESDNDSSVSETEKKPNEKQEITENIESNDKTENSTINTENKLEKQNIWAKRTVDKVFNEALERYLKRKIARITKT